MLNASQHSPSRFSILFPRLRHIIFLSKIQERRVFSCSRIVLLSFFGKQWTWFPIPGKEATQIHPHFVQMMLKSRNFTKKRKTRKVRGQNSAHFYLCFSAEGPQSTRVSTTPWGDWSTLFQANPQFLRVFAEHHHLLEKTVGASHSATSLYGLAGPVGWHKDIFIINTYKQIVWLQD